MTPMHAPTNKILSILGMLRRKCFQRHMGSQTSKRWGFKQVTRSNLKSAIEGVLEDIQNADFISVSLQSTGSHGAPWCRILPFDTTETAYYKAKDIAERYQLLQFAVCPFKWAADSKIIAFPYNFHLFPRDELRFGMSAYSFSCQPSSMTSMAQKGFDFNSWVYEGISCSSKAQEATAKQQGRNSSILGTYPALPNENPHIADIIFTERARSRVQYWRDACLTSSKVSKGRLAHSLMTAVFNNEMFGSRPCLRINAASDRQMQLILEVLQEFSHDLVPLRSSVGEDVQKEIKVIFTSSEEDKHLLLSELQQHTEDQCKQDLRFGDLVDALINSGKTIVGYNCLKDFTIIYSSFLAPLPPTMKEFLCSLQSIFPHVLDIQHLLKEVHSRENPSIRAKNLHAALSYLNRQFSLPLDLEVPLEFKCYQSEGAESHGHTVLRLTYLFAKVCRLLKISLSDFTISIDGCKGALASHENILYPRAICLDKLNYGREAINLEGDSYSKKSHIIFIWGFKIGSTAKAVSEMLTTRHEICQEGIKVWLADKSCAYVQFKRAKYAEIFLQDIQSGNSISGFPKSKPLEEFSFALRAVSYGVYEQLCKSSLWRTNLADSLELVMSESGNLAYSSTADLPSPKNSDLILELDNL